MAASAPPGTRAPSGPELTLTVVAGPAAGHQIPVGDHPVVLGRAQEGSARLGGDPQLSREHLEVSRFDDGRLLVEDLGSTNGTFVNGGQAAGPTVLSDGDVIWIGNTTLLVRAPEQPLPEVAPVEPPAPSREAGFLSKIADRVDKRPKRMLLMLGIAFVVFAVLGGPVTQQLKDEQGFEGRNAESFKATEALTDAAGHRPDPSVIVLVRAPRGDVNDAATKARVNTLERRIRANDDVADVATLYNTNNSFFASRDQKATFIAVFLKNIDEESREDAALKLKDQLERPPNVLFGGQALASNELRHTVETDLRKAEAIAFPILFIVSLFVFRGVVAALMPLFVGVLTIFTTFFFLRIIDAIGTVNVFAINIVTALGLGLAIDYSLLILNRYREELAKVGEGHGFDAAFGATPRAPDGSPAQGFAGSQPEALRRTLFTAGRTVMFSATTVAFALLALCIFPQPFLYSMGIGGAVCAISAALVALIALPTLLAVLGPRINGGAPKRWQRAALRTATQERAGFWYQLSQAVMRRPLAIAVLSAALLLAVGLSFLRIDFTGVNARVLPDKLQARQISDVLSNEFTADPSAQAHVEIQAPPSARPDVERYARDLGRFTDVAAVFPPQSLNRDVWQVDVQPWGNGLDDSTVELTRDLRRVDAPFPVRVAGESAQFIDQQDSLTARLPIALAWLAITTIVVLFIMTGSIILPLKSLVMNLLTISATLGLLVLIFQDGRLEGLLGYTSLGALDASQPILVCALAFGLSTDYAVFLLGRISEARTKGASDHEAVAIGIERTGRIVTQAALLFCIAVLAFATSSVIFIKEAGVGTAAAVIIDSTIIRALLVPSLMALLGRRNWWAPGPLRRLHGRIGLSEA